MKFLESLNIKVFREVVLINTEFIIKFKGYNTLVPNIYYAQLYKK